jgi:amino acid adenylation domain-containing protein/thioester reductase-like protein
VLDLFEHSATITPRADAVVHSGGSLDYETLDRLAQAAAGELAAAGAGRDDLVPLLLEDRVALLVAMLATMKAGAAFVPFDTGWPAQRQVDLLADLAPAVVVGQPPPGAPASRVVTVDLTRRPVTPQPAPPRPRPGDPIYAFFTSGSTGRPKCAINLHRGLVNRFLSMTERFAEDGQVVLQNSAHTFDSSMWQLLWPLTRGATVVIPDRGGILDFDATLAAMHRYGVTMTDFVPTIFDLLVERLEQRRADRELLGSLRQVFIGGEAANPRTVYAFRRMLPLVRITNTYGPTECSIGSVFHAVADADRTVIPLGRPLPNTFVLLLDERGRPTGPGEVGEIHLAGVCLGAGYHGDPGRTRRAFVPNPWPEVPGDRLYRTGDFGWIRDDGVLMFSGRRDAQVQIAGIRVDLREIESCLAGLPGVHQVKALVDDAGSTPTTVCFYAAGDAVTDDDLRGRARRSLPAALVPSRFVRLGTLPLLSNGKVDEEGLRRRLAPAEDPVPGPDSSPEAGIARIWTRVLGFAAPGDDFFQAGGTSLAAARLTVELERSFGLRVSIRDLLRARTIAEQAALVRGARPAAVPVAEVRRDMQRDLCLPPPAGWPAGRRRAPGAVFLVGATGFIGSHLLAALLSRTDRPIVCLARAAGGQRARERVFTALAATGRLADTSRVRVLAGDLSLDRLGLAEPEWLRLCDGIETIVDAGGQVDTLREYADLRTTNINGVRTLIDLAGSRVVKRMVTLSTTTVRDGTEAPLPERFLPPESPIPADGYSQTKWVAEQLLRSAVARGIPVTVVRLGDVAPHSGTGRANPRSLVTMVLRLCLRLGARPATRARVDWTPVDVVADMVAALARPGTGASGVINAVAPVPVGIGDLMGRLALPEVPYGGFLTRAADAIGDDEVARCLAVLRRGPAEDDPLVQVIRDARLGTDTFHASRLARELDLSWHASRDSEIGTMIDRLTRVRTPRVPSVQERP